MDNAKIAFFTLERRTKKIHFDEKQPTNSVKQPHLDDLSCPQVREDYTAEG